VNQEEQLEDLVEEEAAPPEAAEEFEFKTLRPEVSFATRDVQPPSECYISRDDRLRIHAWNVMAGGSFWVHARILRPDGQITQNTWQCVPTSDGVSNAWWEDLMEGFLLALNVVPVALKAGGCYVRVMLVRGVAPPTVPVAETLVCGYLASGSILSWPYPRYVGPCEGPGRLRVIVGTDPAAGLEILEAVPTAVRWRVLSIHAQLTTSAAAADRYPTLWMADGANLIVWTAPVVGQPASTIYEYSWTRELETHSLALYAQIAQVGLPELWLTAGQRIGTNTPGLQAGDNWGAPVLYVEEWVEP